MPAHRLRCFGAGLIVAVARLLAVAAPAVAALGFGIPHLLWTDIYGPTVNQDQWHDIAIGPGHTVYVCGVQGMTQGPGWRFIAARYPANATGTAHDPIWRVSWAPAGADSNAEALALAPNGDMIACGWSSVPTRGFAVVRFAAKDGHVVW